MTSNPKVPKAPKHLAASTRKWWDSVVRDWTLEEHHVRILTAAAESWDRAGEARRLLAREGIVVRDRFGQPKPHPAAAIERDSKSLFARLIRELGLDVDGPSESRPPSVAGRGGHKGR